MLVGQGSGTRRRNETQDTLHINSYARVVGKWRRVGDVTIVCGGWQQGMVYVHIEVLYA